MLYSYTLMNGVVGNPVILDNANITSLEYTNDPTNNFATCAVCNEGLGGGLFQVPFPDDGTPLVTVNVDLLCHQFIPYDEFSPLSFLGPMLSLYDINGSLSTSVGVISIKASNDTTQFGIATSNDGHLDTWISLQCNLRTNTCVFDGYKTEPVPIADYYSVAINAPVVGFEGVKNDVLSGITLQNIYVETELPSFVNSMGPFTTGIATTDHGWTPFTEYSRQVY